MEIVAAPTVHPTPVSPIRATIDLFLVSLLLLFLELALIRWMPAHVLFLTFFTNVVLLACFLGMSVGCLAAGRGRNYLVWTPLFLGLSLFAAQVINTRLDLSSLLDVGNQASPQLVFFGTERAAESMTRSVLPIEVLNGFFFLTVALAMIGPGQEMGRALARLPNRVGAYTINILGSMAGIVLFAICSLWELPPFWWFSPIVVGIGYFLLPYFSPTTSIIKQLLPGLILLAIPGLVALSSGVIGSHDDGSTALLWSPYYRIDYYHGSSKFILVNLIGHQRIESRDDPYAGFAPSAETQPEDGNATGMRRGYSSPNVFAYALPHLLNRDSGQAAGPKPEPFDDVLIIGAGSGNDVSRALQWGAKHIDAVEIDPVVQRIGERDHPDRPYQDERVKVHLDDGRNFLRSTPRQYDLIVYALVDSLVLHSSYSNIRLESYLFTRQAFEDVRRHLKPGGIFVMYNYFRQGWIVARLQKGVAEVFGADPLVLTFPYQMEVQPDAGFGGYALIFSGGAERLQHAFDQHTDYWLDGRQAPGPDSPNGFLAPSGAERRRFEGLSPEEQARGPWVRFGPSKIIHPDKPLRTASDDWPFLYLRQPMIPALSLRGMAIMGGLAILLLLWFVPKPQGVGGRWRLDWRLFLLGAGFMLIETKAVVHMALLFGSTWMVNSVVFFAVLAMILLANVFVLRFKPQRLWPYYVGLLAVLALNCAIPLDFFLGMNRTLQITGSCLLVSVPILFAGVIFAASFGRTAEPERAIGANIAGAMLGGLAEYSSMLLGFQYLVLVAIAFYVLSAIFGGDRKKTATSDADLQSV